MNTDFAVIELIVHTNYGIGLNSIEDIINAAIRRGYNTIGIADLNTVQSFPQAYEESERRKGQIKILYGATFRVVEDLKEVRYYTCFARNQEGLYNLYKLIGLLRENLTEEGKAIGSRQFFRHRQGLLIGVQLMSFFQISENIDKFDFVYEDYVQINHLKTIENCAEEFNYPSFYVDFEEYVALLYSLDIPFIMTSNVHYLEFEDRNAYSKIYNNPDIHDQYLFTMEEKAFSLGFLTDYMVEKILFDNAIDICEQIDKITPLPKGFHKPVLAHAEEKLCKICLEKVKKHYGSVIDERIAHRLTAELKIICRNRQATPYLIAMEIANVSANANVSTMSVNGMGSSFVAYLLGITGIDPLPSHYICPTCKHLEFIEEVSSGYDLPNKICPRCHKQMRGDGHTIPFENYGGDDEENYPKVSLLLTSNVQNDSESAMIKLFPKSCVVRAGELEHPLWSESTAFAAKHQLWQHESSYTEAKIKLTASIGRWYVFPSANQWKIPIEKIRFIGNSLYYDYVDWTTLRNGDPIHVTHYDWIILREHFYSIDLLISQSLDLLYQMEKQTSICTESIPLNDRKLYEMWTSMRPLGFYDNNYQPANGMMFIPRIDKNSGEKLVPYMPTNFSETIEAVCALLDSDTNYDEENDVYNGWVWKDDFIFSHSESKAATISELKLALRLAWYKLYYPAEFYTVLLNRNTVDLSNYLQHTNLSEIIERIDRSLMMIDSSTLKTLARKTKTSLEIIREAMGRGIQIKREKSIKYHQFEVVDNQSICYY